MVWFAMFTKNEPFVAGAATPHVTVNAVVLAGVAAVVERVSVVLAL